MLGLFDYVWKIELNLGRFISDPYYLKEYKLFMEKWNGDNLNCNNFSFIICSVLHFMCLKYLLYISGYYWYELILGNDIILH